VHAFSCLIYIGSFGNHYILPGKPTQRQFRGVIVLKIVRYISYL